jgi:DNA-binding protein HU-beta
VFLKFYPARGAKFYNGNCVKIFDSETMISLVWAAAEPFLNAIQQLNLKHNNMNKAELIDAVQKALGKEATKKCAGMAVSAVLDSIVKGVKKDKSVQVIGFGTFKVTARKARKGRNPKTGASMTIKASKNIRFVASSAIKKGL